MNSFSIRLILDDIRSALNVGAMLRTADAAGVAHVYACGITPYPLLSSDTRPGHIAMANTRAIAKTALGAEVTMSLTHAQTTRSAIEQCRLDGYKVIVIEQSERSLKLYQYVPDGPIALVMGNEVEGIHKDTLALADHILELPMLGSKESLNVSVAAGIALYQLRFGQAQV